MKRFFLRTALFLALFCSGTLLYAGLTLKGDERIICIGDSITHTGGYVANLQQLWMLHHPGTALTFLNAGVSGETAGAALSRLDYDVLSQKPDVAFVMFGMNDVGRDLYKTVQADAETQAKRDQRFQAYCENMEKLTSRLTAAGVKVVLLTPTCYDQYQESNAENLLGCNDPGLARIADFVRKLAKEKGYVCFDLFEPTMQIALGNIGFSFCVKDRVHPGPAGHLLMSIILARSMGLKPEIASVAIDGKEVKAENAAVSDLVRTGNNLKFTYAPKALPLSMRTDGYPKLAASFPVTEEISKEILTVKNMPKGSYSLLADGRKVAVFSDKELSGGVNLALLDTPSAAKSAEIFRLSREMKAAQQRQRGLMFCDAALLRQGRTPGKNRKGDIKALKEWAAKHNSKYFQSFVENYEKNVGLREQLQKNERESLQKMQMIRPEPFTIEIIPIQE